MSEQQQVQQQPKEVRVSASDVVGVLTKILRSIEDQNKLILTQNGILTALLKTSGGIVSGPVGAPRNSAKPPISQINPSQLGYAGMSAGGKQHIPGHLTGLEPPQWTGESQSIDGDAQ